MRTLEQISNEFSTSIHSLRILTEKIAPLADEHDVTSIDDFFADLCSVVGVDYHEAKAKTTSQGPKESAEGGATLNGALESLLKAAELKGIKSQMLLKMYGISKLPTQSGAVLRRGCLIVLISYLDVLIAALLKFFYEKYPAALPIENAQISLTQLREIGSVAGADAFIIDREVDALLRESFEVQLEYFKKRFKIDLAHFDSYKSAVVETIQRRHLWVHNAGVVNRQYLAKVNAELQNEYQLIEGSSADISDQYLRRALDRIHLAGLIILHTCWRKWSPDEVLKAEASLNQQHLYEAIDLGRYKLAQNIGKFIMSLECSEEYLRQLAVLNVAQAYKWDGQPDEMENVLKTRDWSGANLKIKLGLHALRDQIDSFFELAPKAIAADEIKKNELQTYPIFRKMRELPQFEQIIESAV